MTLGSTIARNTTFLLISRIVMAITSLVLFALVGRILGLEGFGAFTLALTYSRFVFVIVDFGAGYLTVREVAREKTVIGKVFVSGILIKIPSILSSIIVLLLVANLFYEKSAIIHAILVAGLAAILEATGNFLRAFFNAHEKMHYTSAFLAGESLAILGICYLLLKFGYDATALLASYSFVYLVSAILALVILFKRFNITPELDLSFTRVFFRQSLPFIVFSAFGVLYSRIDTVLLSILAPAREIAVGVYQASFKLILSSDYLPDMLTKSAYPTISRLYEQEIKYAVELSERILKYLILLGFPIAVGIFLLADDIIMLVYDMEFTSSVIVMQILAWVIPLRYASFLFGTALSATDKQRYRALTTGAVFLVNGILNLILVPRLGYLGSAIVNLVSMLCIFSLYYFFIRRHFAPLNVWLYVKPSIIGSIVMGISIWGLGWLGLPLLTLILFGAIFYFGSLIIIGAIKREDYQIFERMVRGMFSME